MQSVWVLTRFWNFTSQKFWTEVKIIPDNPADVKMIKKENYLNIMDVLLAFSVKFPVTVFDYLHGYTTGMWNTLFLHLRHWTNTLNIYVSAYLCKEVLLLPRFNFTKPHSYWAHTVLWATGSTVWVPKRSHRVEKQTLDVKLRNPKANMLWVYSPCEQTTL